MGKPQEKKRFLAGLSASLQSPATALGERSIVNRVVLAHPSRAVPLKSATSILLQRYIRHLD